jgi:hypothetical protein
LVPLGVVGKLDGTHRIANGIRDVGSSFVLQQHLGEALTSQGVSAILVNVPTGILASRVEIDGTIQTERNVGSLHTRGAGQG